MPLPMKTGYLFSVTHKIKDGRFSMESADVFREFYSIGYFIRGNRLFLTPGKTVQFNGGNMTFVHKNLYHRAVSGGEEPYETIYIRFKDSIIQPLINSIGQEAFDELYDEILINISERGKTRVMEIFQKILSEWKRYDANHNATSELLLTGYVNELFVNTLRERVYDFDTNLPFTVKYPPLVDALKYMEKNFNQSPTLSETAKAIGVTPSHLSKIFTTKLGTSYSRFLNEEKINHAQKLLVNTNLSMVEIAYQCGFTSSNYFSDVFKKVLNVSPLRFRKQMVDT